jgi:hypothetical protein
MPNHCYNVLQVVGYKDTLERFKREVAGVGEKKGSPFSFRRIVPPPCDEILDTVEGYNNGFGGVIDGYHWCQNEWGTKWDAYDFGVDDEEGEVVDGWVNVEWGMSDDCILCSFHTAWGPPKPVMLALGRKYPELFFSLHYEEAGSGFIGDMEVSEGKVVFDEGRTHLSIYDMRFARGG